MIDIVLIACVLVFVPVSMRKQIISDFKIAYYEQKLKNRGVDISSVENITLREVLK